jgi:hypothetical protein
LLGGTPLIADQSGTGPGDLRASAGATGAEERI